MGGQIEGPLGADMARLLYKPTGGLSPQREREGLI